MPFFSVVIPVYNRANLVSTAINSVLEQVFDDFEIIVVDDGSTDNTRAVVKQIANHNEKVKYLWQENKERGAARNYGFKNAAGVYAVFLDSDDYMHLDHLLLLYKKIQEQNFPNFITAKHLMKRSNISYSSPILQELSEGYYDINLVLKGSHFGCNFVVKRNNTDLHLFVEDRIYPIIEDWMFITQNLNHDRIYVVDAYTITMNDHEARSMRGNYKGIIKKRILAAHWLEKNTDLIFQQRKILWGYSYHFCAIYSYIGGNRAETFQYLLKSIRLVGLDFSRAQLIVKTILGFRFIQYLKR